MIADGVQTHPRAGSAPACDRLAKGEKNQSKSKGYSLMFCFDIRKDPKVPIEVKNRDTDTFRATRANKIKGMHKEVVCRWAQPKP